MTSSNSATFMHVFCILALFLAGCGAGGTTAEVQEVPPGIAFEELRFRSYRGSALSASGEADRASFRRDTTDVSAVAIRLRLPGVPGEPDHQVDAPRGAGNMRAGEGQLTGGVTVVIRGVRGR
jgi:hypothetical protein